MKVTDFFATKVVYDKMGQYLWCVEKNGHHKKLADLRGWGSIQQLFRKKDDTIDFDAAAKYQDEIGQFVADAINEKIK